MDFQRKTLDLFAAVNAILGQYDGPLTLRQVFYRLVAAQQLENTRAAYCGLSKHLVNARLAGIVDDSRIVDRVRNTLRVPCWNDLPDFLETVRQSYRRKSGHVNLMRWRCGARRTRWRVSSSPLRIDTRSCYSHAGAMTAIRH